MLTELYAAVGFEHGKNHGKRDESQPTTARLGVPSEVAATSA